MGKVLLDLDTLVVRPMITIDGKKYEILSPDELPVITSHMLATKGKRLDELMRTTELSQEDEGELTTLVRDISDRVMEPVPDDIRKKLSDTHRIAVVEVFSALLLTGKAATAAATIRRMGLTAGNSTGEKPSPASSASTEARRTGGSSKRRSRS